MIALNTNYKYKFFYTFDKDTQIIFDENNKPLNKNHILYIILEKYKDLLYLTDIKIIPHKTIEEADNNLVYKGYDSKHKLQYRYGINYINSRKNKKLQHFLNVYNNMDIIQDIIDTGIKEKTINKTFLFATILLLELTFFIRLGKDIYLETNETVGLLTLQKKHLIKNLDCFRIEFKGKTGKNQSFICSKETQPILYNVLSILFKNAKEENDYIFTYDENKKFTERMLNERLKLIGIRLKDFRTYGVNIVLIKTIFNNIINEHYKNEIELKKILNKSIDETAQIIGHTKSISKKSYLSEELQDILQKILLKKKFTNFELFLKTIISKLKTIKKK